MNSRISILLINIGTPKNTSWLKVGRFLSRFLNDKRVIDLPYIVRKILVNLIIVPFRTAKSAKLYKKLWTKNGSPLLYYSLSLKEKLQKQLGENFQVELGMRYSRPSIKDALRKIKENKPVKFIVIPLFPQYASSTTKSAIEKFKELISKWEKVPKVHIVRQFYDNAGFIESFTKIIKEYQPKNYEHILFSFHGLPLRQVNKSHPEKTCKELECTERINKENASCYQAQCYETARLLTKELKLTDTKYTVCFQSRFAKKWLSPFTDEVIKELAARNLKKILVVSPAFVADCLETNVEIGIEYKELFESLGGEKLELVKSLNDNENWIKALTDLIRAKQNS